MAAPDTINTFVQTRRGRGRRWRQHPRPAEHVPAVGPSVTSLRVTADGPAAAGEVKYHAGRGRRRRRARHHKHDGPEGNIRHEHGHRDNAQVSDRPDVARDGDVYTSRTNQKGCGYRGRSPYKTVKGPYVDDIRRPGRFGSTQTPGVGQNLSGRIRREDSATDDSGGLQLAANLARKQSTCGRLGSRRTADDDWCSDDEGDFCPFDDYVDFMKRRLGLPEPVILDPPRPEILDMAVSEIACPPRKRAQQVTGFRPHRQPESLKTDSARKSAFQRLPNEIRQKVYDIICDTFRVEVQYARRYNMDRPLNAISYRLRHRQLWPRDETTQTVVSRTLSVPPWFPSLPFGLVFSCKSIYHETLLLLYSRMQFVFNSSNAIKRFLQTVPSDAQTVIRHVEINQLMYSEPSLTRFRHWKELSDRTFIRTSHAMSEALTSLRILHVNYKIRDWPIRLTSDERWAVPLLFFCAGHDGRLEYARITLDNPRIKHDKLEKAAKELERRMTKPEAFQMREDARLARELSGPIKAAKVLRIVL